MDKYDSSQLTEFPRFEPETPPSGVSTFLNKLWKFPLFSPTETGENLAGKALTQAGSQEQQSSDQNRQEYENENPETGSYAVELEGRSLPNVLRRISSLIASGSGSGKKYADTELARYWMPDDISRECYECATRFSTLRRRHHCRVCGQIFCSRCCSQRVPGHIFGCAGGLRVCNYCCNVVLSYLRENELTGEVSTDLKTLQDNLRAKFPERESNETKMNKKENFMFDRDQEDARELRPSHKEALQDTFRYLSASLPTQHHRFRLVRYNGVWRGADILQWIMDNTTHKTRGQASEVCGKLLNAGYIESQSELPQFADYALYKPIVLPPVEQPQDEEDTPEETPRLVESVSSYCLDLNLGENSARLIKAPKSEAQPSPASDEEHPILENSDGGSGPKRVCPAILESGEEHLRLLLLQCLARHQLPSSWRDVLLPLCVEAAAIITPDVFSNDIDVRHYVQVKKVPGGAPKDSCIIQGVVLTKNVAHRAMPQRIVNPTVLLLDCSITYQRVEGKLTSLEPVLLQEQEYVSRMAARVLALRAGAVLARGGVTRQAATVLGGRGVSLAAGVARSALSRAQRCLGAALCTSVHARVGTPRLGTCQLFYVQSYPTKTLMIFEGCENPHLGCCILLRGASIPELIRVKKVVRFMLLACYNWKLEKSFLSDIEAVLPEPGMTFDDDDDDEKPNSDGTAPGDKKKRESDEKTVEVDPLLNVKGYTRKTDSDKNLSCGVPIKDFSDPLQATLAGDDEVFVAKEETALKADSHAERWSTDDVVLSMSPNVIIPAPNLDPETNALLLNYKVSQGHRPSSSPAPARSVSSIDDNVPLAEQHPFIRDPITLPADDASVRAALAHYRATDAQLHRNAHQPSCPLNKRPVLKKRTKAVEKEAREKETENTAPLDPLAPENHQRLSLLLYSYSDKSANVPDFCVNPWTVNMEMYSRHDISLGAFLEKYCFNENYKCPSKTCQVPMNQHVRKFIHGDVCITINCNTIGHSNVDKAKEEQNKQVMFWSRCQRCGESSRVVRLSRLSLSLSLAQYIRLRCSAPRYLSVCRHPLHAHTHAFLHAHTTARCSFSKITTYDVQLPPEVITTKYDTKQMRDTLINQLNDLVLKGHEIFSSLSADTDAEKDYHNFKQHTDQMHLALTSNSLQEQTSLAAVVRSLWSVSDRVIIGEKMLRDAQEKWSSPPLKTNKQHGDNVEEKSDIEDSSGDASNSDNSGTTYVFNSDSGSKEVEKEHTAGEEDEEKGDKKTVRQILSQLLSNNQPSNQSGMIITSGIVPVSVQGGEAGSVVAAALTSLVYLRTLHLHSTQSEQEDSEKEKDKTDSSGDKSKAKSNDHIEVLVKDGLVCRVYYAIQFQKLRHMLLAPLSSNTQITDDYGNNTNKLNNQGKCACELHKDKDPKSLCEIEEGFIRSLAYCVPWAAKGGKSGSTFCKTKDDRYVLKEMTKPEWQQFLEFAPHYFNYVTTCRQNKQQSLLARIVGVYSVGGAGNGVLVMENVWYCCPETARYDLKGAARHRLALRDQPQAVLMDENLLHLRWQQQLVVSGRDGGRVGRCVARDTHFLATHLVMDYSLLLAINHNTLVLGIIDYIRTFTWDKKLEHLVKKNLGSGQPTVVSPEQYRDRFITACKKYFLQCPTHWDHFYDQKDNNKL